MLIWNHNNLLYRGVTTPNALLHIFKEVSCALHSWYIPHDPRMEKCWLRMTSWRLAPQPLLQVTVSQKFYQQLSLRSKETRKLGSNKNYNLKLHSTTLKVPYWSEIQKNKWKSHLNICNSTNSTYISCFYRLHRSPQEFLIHKKLTYSSISACIFWCAYLNKKKIS